MLRDRRGRVQPKGEPTVSPPNTYLTLGRRRASTAMMLGYDVIEAQYELNVDAGYTVNLFQW